MEILKIENLSFKYSDAEKYALEDVSLSVNAGDFIVLCGKSGCGKSTLLKLIKREISPYGQTSGKIYFNGKDINELSDRESASKIGYVMQSPDSQIVTDKVWHELAFGLESMGLKTDVIRRRVAENASYFGIEGWYYKNTDELSGGQKQILNLASVMAMQPDILLLDEPCSQLDPNAATSFISTIKKLNEEFGVTIIIAEHRLEEVFDYANKLVFIDNGRIEFCDSPKNCLEFLGGNDYSDMITALPCSVRILNALGCKDACSASAKDCRRFITDTFENSIRALTEKSFSEGDEVAVELKDVWFRYEKNTPDIAKGISFKIYKNECFTILGGNGTGKTTALNLIADILKPYRGEIFVLGKKLRSYLNNSLYKNCLTLLSQNPQNVFLEDTLLNDYSEVCKAMGYSKDEAKNEIEKLSQMFGISHLLSSHPYDLSGGEQQKAALLKVLLLKPQILLLDEPSKGIDAYSKKTLCSIIKDLKAQGITVITVTHDIEFACEISDRCALFFDGDLISCDTPQRFFSSNSFYTTVASRITRGFFDNTVTCDDVVRLCLDNKRRANEQ